MDRERFSKAVPYLALSPVEVFYQANGQKGIRGGVVIASGKVSRPLAALKVKKKGAPGPAGALCPCRPERSASVTLSALA